MVEIKVLREKCKGCKLCVHFCPREVLEISPRTNSRGFHFPQVKTSEKCSGCCICALMCPDVAIEIYEETTSSK